MKTFAFGFVFACLSYSSFCQQQSDDIDTTISIIRCPVEYSAQYPKGINSLKKFIKKNLKYPKQDIVGKVFVRFIVNVDGSLSDFEVMKGLCDECDKNAIDVLKKMPKWIPAKMNGVFVKSRFTMPVSFD